MKNSAWYQKLWRKKLDELPLEQDARSRWSDMKKLLDEHMPETGTVEGNRVKPSGTSLVSLLGYIIPAAAMIGAIGYFYFLVKPEIVQVEKTKQQIHLDMLKHSLIKIDRMRKDSIYTKQLPLTGNAFVKNGNATIYPNKNSNAVNKAETATLNSGTMIKALSGGSRFYQVMLPKRTTSISSKRSLPFTSKEKPNGLQNHSGVQKIVNENEKQIITNKGKHTDSVDKIISEGRYSNGKNDAEYSNSTNKQPVRQALAGDVAKFDPVKQAPAIAAAVKKDNDQHKVGGKPDVVKSKNTAKGKKTKVMLTPPYNYGLETGLNTGNNVSFYLGAFGSYAVNKRWLFDAEVRINSYRKLSGEYSHPSYYRPDSLPPFKIIDSRKLLVLDIPINLEYRISKTISIKAGPVISLSLKQTGISSRLSTIADLRDTVYHTKEINKAINNTVISKVSFGFTSGLSFHLKKFDLNGNYQLLTPYKVSNDLGSYRKAYYTFQIGIGYGFK